MANGTVDEVKIEFVGEDDVSKPATDVADSIRDVGKAADEASKSTDDAAKKEKEYEKALAAAKQELSKYTPTLVKYGAALKRVATYRAIRAVLKEITQGFKEGVNNAYQYSKAMNGSFASAMDTFATAKQYLANSIGAMAMPILEKLIKVVDGAIEKFVELLNVANEVFTRLSGKDVWTRAKKVPVEYAKSTNAATKANEKFKKSLLGIDEINKLQDNSSSGGSASGSGADYTIMFEQVKFTDERKAEIDELIKKIEGIGVAVGVVWATIKAFKIYSSIHKIVGLLEEAGIPLSSIFTKLGSVLSVIVTVVGWFLTFKGLIDIISGEIDILNGDKLGGMKKVLKGVMELATGISIIFGFMPGLLVLVGATLLTIVTNWKTWSDAVKRWFNDSDEYWRDWKIGLQAIFDTLGIKWDGLADKITNRVRSIVEWFGRIFSWIGKQFSKVSQFFGNNNRNVNRYTLDYSPSMFADGGFPTQGQLFWANENGAGPELVGTIGNKTAVANSDQIIGGVAQGVAEANESQNALLREQNSLLRALLNKDSNVYPVISTQDITQGLQRQNRRNGVTTVPVGV